MIYAGNALTVLRTLSTESVQCVVTSPPYWGLRDYGHPDQIGLEPTPEEYVAKLVAVFEEVRRVLKKDGTLWLNLGDCYATGAGTVGPNEAARHRDSRRRPPFNGRGEEQSVLKGHRGSRGGSAKQPHTGNAIGPMIQPNRLPIVGLKPKDMVGIPWRVAFALQAAGWYLRADIIWSKANPMPSSVKDRPTSAHEYVFLLTKSRRYYYDHRAIMEPFAEATKARPWTNTFNGEREDVGAPFRSHDRRGTTRKPAKQALYATATNPATARTTDKLNARWDESEERGTLPDGRNKRSVWTLPSQPFKEAHFATMPPKLVEPCLLAGSRQGDTVMDPFAGAGTVGFMAAKLSREFVGIELNPQYVALAERRIRDIAPLFSQEKTA